MQSKTGGGRLYVVATPLGNLGDLSPRAAATLANECRRSWKRTGGRGTRPSVIRRTSGETNILGFDKEGNVVFDKDVTVVPHNARTVTLHRAGASETFACAPRCEATLRAGDDIVKFEPLSKEVETVVKFANGQASSANKGGESKTRRGSQPIR